MRRQSSTNSTLPTSSGVLNVLGGTALGTTGSGNTVTINADAGVATTYTTDSGTATPVANNLDVLGGTGIDTSGSGDTVTITAADAVPLSFVTDSGTATPSSNSVNVFGGTNVDTTGSGATITVNSTISGGDGGDFLWWTDCTGSAADANLTSVSITAKDDEDGHDGIWQMGSCSTTRGIGVGGGAITIKIWARHIGGITSSNNLWFGLVQDTGHPSTETDAIAFATLGSDSTTTLKSYTRASSSETRTDSIQTLDTNWHLYEIKINAGGTSVDFDIDSSNVATHTTNIPTASLLFVANKNATADYYIDYISIHKDYTGDRA